ncbi:FAD-dependent oxidoreductase [Dyella agri]|uniref:NAD(P)/FAD-dependent oxidoreductase n=1 Tax=Dyella agri TaxID=1926869 RepID=A0ABW8KKW8_9GAMM
MKHDVAIVGGSYSGMAAALQLLRARRSVLVIDDGKRRNRSASHSHGLLGQDGVDPAELARIARAQLALYPTLTWLDGAVEQVAGSKDAFHVSSGGSIHSARRLLLAVGVLDRLPDIPGLLRALEETEHHAGCC